jgi:hypothetical protein
MREIFKYGDNKNVDIKFSAQTVMTNNLKVFAKPKRPNQNRQNRLRSQMPEEENLSFDNNYII